jgi:hypothetical protein
MFTIKPNFAPAMLITFIMLITTTSKYHQLALVGPNSISITYIKVGENETGIKMKLNDLTKPNP